MKIPKFLQHKKTKPLGLIAFGGEQNSSYLVASTEKKSASTAETSVRGILEQAKLIEALGVKIASYPAGDYVYPEDHAEYEDYYNAYRYVAKVNRAVQIKHAMIWQNGYDTLVENDESGGQKEALDAWLKKIQGDVVFRDGSVWAIVLGNMYWHIEKKANEYDFPALNPLRVGVKLINKKEIKEYIFFDKNNNKTVYPADEILHLRFNAEPWEVFGRSSLMNVIPTIKAILYMEQKLPWLARRYSRPLLYFQIGGENVQVGEQEFKRLKTEIENRPEDKDIFNDGSITKIEEVYKSMIGSKSNIETVLAHFEKNLVAGLGVPEVALGIGGTSTMATAEYQERLLEAEIHDYQRCLKRFHENQLFKLIDIPGKVTWRPLKEEDKFRLSEKLCREIVHGIISPEYASAQLGYPEEALTNRLINGSLRSIDQPAPLAEPSEEEKLRLAALRKIVQSDA